MRSLVGTVLLLGLVSVSSLPAESPGPSFLGNRNIPPFLFLDNDKPRGVVADLFQAMQPLLPPGASLQAMDWKQAQAQVSAGEAQALVQINRTPAREQLYDFSEPLLESKFVLFVRTSQLGISSVTDLAGKRVGVEEAGLPRQVLSADPAVNLVFISDFPTAFAQLAAGTLDAVSVDERVGEYVLATRKIGGIKSTGLAVVRSSSSIAVRKGDKALLDAINAALAALRTDGTYQKILNNWNPSEVIYETRAQAERNQSILLSSILGAGLLVALLWGFSLYHGLRRARSAEASLRSDMAERDKLERLLESSQSQLNGILQNSQDAIGVHHNGVWEIVNPAAVRLFGVGSEAELIGTPVLSCLAPEEEPRIREYLRKRTAGESAPDHYLTQGRRCDGTVFEMEVTLSEYEVEGRNLVLVILRDVSERVRKAREVQESEELYRTLVTTSPDPVVLHQQTRILYANPAALLIFGARSAEELVGTSILDRFHPDVLPLAQGRIGFLEPGQPAEVFQGKLLPLHGEPVDAEIMGGGLLVAGKPTVLMLIHELTERNEAKARQDALLKRYETILNNAGDGIHILDENGRVLDVNPAFCAMLGYTREELLTMRVSDWEVQWSDSEILSMIEEFLQKPQIFETRIRRKDSTIRDLQVSSVGIELGGVRYIFSSARDVTERKRAESMIQSQAAQLRAIYDTIPDLVWLKDNELRFLSGNHRIELLFGLPEREIIGKTVTELLGGSIAEFVEVRDRLAMGADGPLINEEDLTFADGHTEVTETIKAAVHDKDGAVVGVLGIGRNITARKTAEKENAKLQSELARAQRLESLGVLASGLAHEMNNVLASISTVAATKRLVLPEADTNRRSFEMIAKAAERGGKTVRNLLGFARRTVFERRTVDWNELITGYAPLLRQTLPAHIRLEVDLDPGVLAVEGDPSALTQALADLCSNAVDALPHEGTLTLRTRPTPGFTVVSVEDTGIGMTDDVRERALDPFFTTKSEGKGTGLGLALVYRTLEAHHATLQLESRPGEGTRVIMPFPVTAVHGIQTDETVPARPVKGLRVLVVDDDPQLLESVKELIETLGNLTETAAGGRQALRLLEQGHNPDVVILDLNMPDLDGAQTLARLRPLYPDLPVVLSTGRTDQVALDLVEAYPRVSLLAKPYTIEELTRELDRVT